MRQVLLKEVKKNGFFTLKNYGDFPDAARVYVRGDYERSEKKYSCYKYMDVNAETFKKGNTKVFVDFIF